MILNYLCIPERTDSKFVPSSQELYCLDRILSDSLGRWIGIKDSDALPAHNPHSKTHKSGHKCKVPSATWKSATLVWSQSIVFNLKSVSYSFFIWIYLHDSFQWCLSILETRTTWFFLKVYISKLPLVVLVVLGSIGAV